PSASTMTATSAAFPAAAAAAPPTLSQALSSSASALPSPTTASLSRPVPSGARISTLFASLPEKPDVLKTRGNTPAGSQSLPAGPGWPPSGERSMAVPFLGAENLAKEIRGLSDMKLPAPAGCRLRAILGAFTQFRAERKRDRQQGNRAGAVC